MAAFQFQAYRHIFKNRPFLAFWLGFTFSDTGDAMTRVALTWLVYEKTKSPQALGILTIAYTAPILVGGLLAGPLLDRYPRRYVMSVDNLLRGIAISLLPLLYLLGRLEVWHAYAFAVVYGSLMMVSLAGSPALVPSMVSPQQLETANALETLSFTLSSVIGPPIAGFLVAWVGAANVVLIDALSYFTFAGILLCLPIREPDHPSALGKASSLSIVDALRLMISNQILLSTTLMFMAANIGLGVLTVLLPFLADRISSGSSTLYGGLLGVLALGEVLSAALVGSASLRMRLGKRIALAQAISGGSLLLLYLGPRFVTVAIGLFLLGFFSAPLTIWAQTLRMRVIPPELSGRTFALLRTLMQGATPLGGGLAGFLLPLAGPAAMLGLAVLAIGLPGLVGLKIRALVEGG